MYSIDFEPGRAADERMTVCGEQARLLTNSTRTGVATNLVAGGFAAGAMFDSTVPWPYVAAWFALLSATVVYRIWVASQCNPDGDPKACRDWLARFSGATTLMGLAWGLLGIAFFLDIGHLSEALIVTCLIGVAGAATASFGVHTRAAMGFCVPALAPMAIYYGFYALNGSITGIALTVLPVIYLGLLHGVARLREASVRAAVAQWERSHALAEQLRIVADYSYAWENWFTDDGKLLWVNPSVEHVTGYTPDECLRMKDYPMPIIHPDDRDRLAGMIEETRRTGSNGKIENRIVRKDGAVRWTAADWQPARDSQGNPSGMRVSVRDITDNVELRRELERQASTDPLTGLMNRRRFLEVCEGEIYRAARFGRPVALAMFDLDYFKRINDTHGHAVGDLCLRAFVGAIQANVRQTDTLARFGGEEFTLLMPETDLDAATALCDRLRAAVARATVTTTRTSITFTVSVGVTACDPHETSIDPALARADTALYAAKNKGRNQVRNCAAAVRLRRLGADRQADDTPPSRFGGERGRRRGRRRRLTAARPAAPPCAAAAPSPSSRRPPPAPPSGVALAPSLPARAGAARRYA